MQRFFKLNTVITQFIVWTLFGCIQEIEVFQDSSTFLVVDGTITDQPGPEKVKLQYSSSFNAFPDYDAVKNSQVVVADNLGNEEIFTYTEYGVFHSSDDFDGVVGRSYKLRVKLESGEEYESLADTLFPVPTVDSIRYQLVQHKGADEIRIYVEFQDDPATENFYRWRYRNTYEFLAPIAYEMSKTNKQMKNSKCYTWDPGPPPLSNDVAICWITVFDNEYLQVEHDALFNGRYMKNFPTFTVPFDRKFDRGYYAEVWQTSLSKAAYTYWKAIQEQGNNNGTIFEEPNYQIRGNIFSTTDKDEVVLGFFGASAVKKNGVSIRDYMGLWGNVCCDCAICTPPRCLDCRNAGTSATNVMPDFWQ